MKKNNTYVLGLYLIIPLDGVVVLRHFNERYGLTMMRR